MKITTRQAHRFIRKGEMPIEMMFFTKSLFSR